MKTYEVILKSGVTTKVHAEDVEFKDSYMTPEVKFINPWGFVHFNPEEVAAVIERSNNNG